ncbi:hypothetical protein B0T25DRAFT_586023 [Lasiosphaeria hispida]|uniref:BTB domain-containing protein n=1 Tax=Lasiosphaeria hispida TaxID=260671 RepID=A0AAJ0H7E4_9PEZI|nr:hypothetical protein B0T25DRAFT_586023 [Lasiosphaeria hispida]
MSSDLTLVVVASPFANMAPLYEVDPEADLLLLVPPRTTAFAPWDAAAAPLTNGTSSSSAAQQQHKSAALASASGLRIKVSSKHLALASRVFKNKLQFAGAGKGGSTTQSDGRVHLSLAEGFEPKAVRIVLDAIHGRGRKVPKAVDLETLAQIALFVDRFQLGDAVEVYADRWIGNLEGSLPEAYSRDLVLWIYASYVFGRADVFKTVTKLAAARSDGPVRHLGLPIKEKIIRDIDAQRQELVGKSLTLVHGTLDNLTDSSVVCSRFHCDSFLLGQLIKTLRKSGVVWPRPAKPFAGVSHVDIADTVNSNVQFRWRNSSGNSESGIGIWGVAVNGNGASVKASSRKRKSPVQQPITPGSSPEPTQRPGITFETHVCDAKKLVTHFDELDVLEDGVKGLDLQSSLGYQLY